MTTATFTKQPANRFTKGSGCYDCRCCGVKTRDTGGDGSGVKLCDMCFELAGYDNLVGDGGALTAGDILGIQAMSEAILKRGGKVEFDNLTKYILADAQTEPVEPFYLVTITGTNPTGELEPILLAVDANKSSRARRAAKQELKAAGIDITGLKFNACKA